MYKLCVHHLKCNILFCLRVFFFYTFLGRSLYNQMSLGFVLKNNFEES